MAEKERLSKDEGQPAEMIVCPTVRAYTTRGGYKIVHPDGSAQYLIKDAFDAIYKLKGAAPKKAA